jgi:hypothetical protein
MRYSEVGLLCISGLTWFILALCAWVWFTGTVPAWLQHLATLAGVI